MFIDPLFPLLAQPNFELSVFVRLPHDSLDFVMSPLKWLFSLLSGFNFQAEFSNVTFKDGRWGFLLKHFL